VKLCPQVGQATVCPAISTGASIFCWQAGQSKKVDFMFREKALWNQIHKAVCIECAPESRQRQLFENAEILTRLYPISARQEAES
jgi:hypothetical protein